MLSACGSKPLNSAPPVEIEPVDQYQYQIGLGYGFLDKQVQVSVDGEEILSIVGTEEIEEFAQLLGTKMLGGGSSDNTVITVQVVVEGGPPFEQVIDLSEGGFIHIYNPETGMEVFNTAELVLE
jgi:hypothetical protein